MAMQLRDITNFMGLTNIKKTHNELPLNPKFNEETAGTRKTLLAWETTTRTNYEQQKLSSRKNRTLLIIGGVIALLLVSMGEFLLIAVISSIIFIKHILAATPPRSVEHSISTHGVDYSGEFYSWGDLKSFYFTRSGAQDILCIDTLERLPGRLFLTLNDGDKEKAKEVCNEYLTFIPQEPRNAIDKMYSAALDKITLD